MMGPTSCPETSVRNYQPTPITSQKSEGLNFTAAEARNLAHAVSCFHLIRCSVTCTTDSCAEGHHETINCGAVRSRTMVRNFLHSHTIATTTTTTTSRQTVLIESDILRLMFLLSRGTPRRRWADNNKWVLKTGWEDMGWINPLTLWRLTTYI